MRATVERDRPAAEPLPIPRAYRRHSALAPAARVALFAERCADYRATVRVVTASELPDAIATTLRARGARRVAIPRDLPDAWRPVGTEWIEDDGLAPDALDAVDGVLTGCAVAIAETATIVLDGGATQGRRALTLIPDLHICVVAAEQIVELVPEAIERLAGAVHAGAPLTMIAGPSATSDIELERVEGVHGPRTLDVLVAR